MTTALIIFAAIIFAIVIALIAPINIALRVAYSKNAPMKYLLGVSYVGDFLCRYSHSSKGERLTVFGFAMKLKKRTWKKIIGGEDGGDGGDDSDGGDEIKSIVSRMKSAQKRATSIWRRFYNHPNRGKIVKWLLRLPRLVLRMFRFKRVTAHIAFGSDDPALVGQAFGYFEAARHTFQPLCKRIDLSMTPLFMETRVEADVAIAMRTSLAAILYQTIIAAVIFTSARRKGVSRNAPTKNFTKSPPEPTLNDNH